MSAARCDWCALSFWRGVAGHPAGGFLACTQINDGFRVLPGWHECDRYQREPGADDSRGDLPE